VSGEGARHHNKQKCAEILKIDYTTLFDKIKKYEIDKELD